MLTRRWAIALLALGAAGLVGFKSAQNFRPPRMAIVDISEVFENYEKKNARQEVLAAEAKKVETSLKELETRLQTINEEVQLLQAGEKRKNLLLEKAQLEIEMKDVGAREANRLREKQLGFLRDLREEIGREIEVYAEAYDLDVVVERSVTADPGGQSRAEFRWPIVHFAKPEIDITQQIIQRLNERYRKSR